MTGKVTVMPNGIRVLSIQMPHMESVMVAAFVNVGSRNETIEQNGISHYLEHMAFKGTETKECFDIMADVEMLGASVNAFTGKDRTAYYVSGRSNHLPEFVGLIGDILLNSTLPDAEIERERGVILQEYNRSQDSGNHVAHHLFDSAAYSNQAVGRKILGEPHNIKSFVQDDFKQYMSQYYTGSNMIVGVIGSFDEAELMQLVDTHFGALPVGTPTELVESVYTGGVEVSAGKFDQANILIGFPIHGVTDPRFYADVMAATILGNGMSSPLFTEVREKRGLVYSVSSYATALDDSGMLTISAGTTPEHFDEYFKVVCQLLKQHTTTIDPADMVRARNQLVVSEMRKSERPFGYLIGFVEDIFINGDQISIKEQIARIEAVTEDDVMNSMKLMLSKVPTLSMCGAGADAKYYDVIKDLLK